MDSEPASTPTPPSPESSSPAPGSESRHRTHSVHRRRRRKRVSDHAPGAHAAFDVATEWLLYLLIVLSTWTLGATPAWAFWTTQALALLLGGLWLAKRVVRRLENYDPPRWGESPQPAPSSDPDARPRRPLPLTTLLLAAATCGILGYVLVGALNARNAFDPATGQFRALGTSLPFLPGTEDRGATWQVFVQFLALAAVFWAVRDWLLHRVARDGKDTEAAPQAPSLLESITIPYRLRRLLWAVSLNAAALATVAILHRADGAEDVLWLVSRDPASPGGHAFGPWSNATHAAQYFNLIWPVCLGFWLWLHERALRSVDARKARIDGPQLVLIPVTALVAAAALFSDGAGGTLVAALAGVGVVLLTLLVSRQQVDPIARWGLVGGVAVGAAAYALVSWRHVADQVGRVDRRVLAGLEVGAGDFTLLARLRLPPPSPEPVAVTPRPLLSLGGDADGPLRSNAVHLVSLPAGGLRVSITGHAAEDVTHFSTGVLPNQSTNREVTITVIRQGVFRVFLNAVEVSGSEHDSGSGPGARALVRSRYLAVQDPAVREVALANFALTRDELAAAIRGGLPNLPATLATGTLSSRDLALDTNEIQLPPQTLVALAPRPTTPNVRWLTVRRASPTGVLGFTRPLAGLDPRLHAASVAAMKVWNQGEFPLYLSGSLREGRRSTVEIAPRSEAAVAIPLLPGGPGGEPTLEIAVTDASGENRLDLPMGTQLFLRDLQLQSLRSVFAQRLEEAAPLAVLRDQLMGRTDRARNARRMASEHGLLGAGAGSFQALYTRYRQPDQQPAASAGNDWLELRITLGWFGLAAALVALAALILKALYERGIPALKLTLALAWLGPASCLVHAIFDDPFHAPSVALAFVLLSAVLSVLSLARRA